MQIAHQSTRHHKHILMVLNGSGTAMSGITLASRDLSKLCMHVSADSEYAASMHSRALAPDTSSQPALPVIALPEK